MPPKKSTDCTAKEVAIPRNLLTLDRSQIEALWQQLFGRPLASRMKRSIAAELIYYEMQAAQQGGLSNAADKHLARLLPSGTGVPKQGNSSGKFKPGTRLMRRWRGQVFMVTVAENGFVYEARHFRSLSVIAREITGTSWSGPAFFGLNKSRVPRKEVS